MDRKKGVEDMAAVTVKPIRPTIVTDPDIIKQIIAEVQRPPSEEAMLKNRECKALLDRARRNK